MGWPFSNYLSCQQNSLPLGRTPNLLGNQHISNYNFYAFQDLLKQTTFASSKLVAIFIGCSTPSCYEWIPLVFHFRWEQWFPRCWFLSVMCFLYSFHWIQKWASDYNNWCRIWSTAKTSIYCSYFSAVIGFGFEHSTIRFQNYYSSYSLDRRPGIC